MVHGRLPLALSVSLAIICGCSTAAFKSNEIRFKLGESKVIVKETGAIIIGKRQVARLLEDGKVVDSNGRPMAWLRPDSVQLKGGINIPINRDGEGALSLSRKAQEKADLEPVVHRVKPDGTMASTKNSRGIEVAGAHLEKNRRIILLVLLMSSNDIWK